MSGGSGKGRKKKILRGETLSLFYIYWEICLNCFFVV